MARQTAQQDEIQSLVESFASELTALVRRTTIEQLQQALGDFSGGATPVAKRTVRVVRMGRSAKKGSGGKRTPEQVHAFGETLYAFIKKSPGQRGEQIAAALKTDVKTMRLPLLRLIADKKVKTKGQRRGMTYFAA